MTHLVATNEHGEFRSRDRAQQVAAGLKLRADQRDFERGGALRIPHELIRQPV
jgi:hypothetical protein